MLYFSLFDDICPELYSMDHSFSDYWYVFWANPNYCDPKGFIGVFTATRFYHFFEIILHAILSNQLTFLEFCSIIRFVL